MTLNGQLWKHYKNKSFLQQAEENIKNAQRAEDLIKKKFHPFTPDEPDVTTEEQTKPQSKKRKSRKKKR